MRVDLAQAREFFRVLYPDGFGGLFVEVRCLPAATQAFCENRPTALRQVGRECGRGLNVHFTPALKGEKAGSHSAVASVPVLFADFDGPGAGEALENFPLPPSVVVSSGHGLHAYWRLSRPVTPAVASGLLYGIAKEAGADPAASYVGSMLRVPGTWNLKREPVPVELRSAAEHVFDSEDFSSYHREREATPGASLTPATCRWTSEGPPARFFVLLQRSSFLSDLWGGRKGYGDTTRSGMDMSLAAFMVREKFSEQEIFNTLMAYPHGKATGNPRYTNYTIGKAMA